MRPRHADYMAHALRLAHRGWYSAPPNPRVGCVLVQEQRIVGEGWHARTGQPHAEINALRDAETRGRNTVGATAYVTLEPCCHQGRTPPCTDAMIAAGIGRAFIGMRDPNPRVAGRGIAALGAAGIEVETGLLEADCRALNPGFISRMSQGRPLVRLKMAMSLDGRIAAASGESQWITGEAARSDVHRLRAQAGAVLTGSETALADDPSLNVRLPGEWRQPLRVVLDTRLRLPPTARMLDLPGRTIVMTAAQAGPDWDALAVAGAQLYRMPTAGAHLDLHAVLFALATEEINEVLVEAGPTLGGALLEAGLVDELVLYIAPSLLGDQGRGLLNLAGVRHLADRVALDIVDVRAVGGDWRITARPAQGT